MITCTKIFTFAAAHYLPNHDGKCQNLHGHNYKLEVTVKGDLKKEGSSKGMVIDFYDLKTAVNEHIIDKLDHNYLNDIFDFDPTCENMLEWMGDMLVHLLNIHKLKLWESDNGYVEWTNDDK